MEASIKLDRVSELGESDRAAVQALAQAVYPPEELRNWPGRRLEWATPEWCVRVWGADGQLASYVGVLLRRGGLDGKPVLMGGVGSVKTRPAARRQGFAGMGMRKAVEFFQESPDVGFALLVCEGRLIPYYGRLGWQEFGGELIVQQHGEPSVFTFNRVMTFGIGVEAPLEGTIDLHGPPW